MSGHTPIPGVPNYAADSDGRIWSIGFNWRGYGVRQVTPVRDPHGYLKVRVVLGGKRMKRFVHNLVALAFVGPRPSPAHEVRHLNGVRDDNRASNLAWGTRKENAADREAHGRTSRGDRHSAAIRAGLEARRG